LEHSRKMYMATIGHYSRGSMICFYLRKSHVFKYYLSIIWTQFYCKRKSLYLIVSLLFIDCRLQLFLKKLKQICVEFVIMIVRVVILFYMNNVLS
jgi:hypothetical protein